MGRVWGNYFKKLKEEVDSSRGDCLGDCLGGALNDVVNIEFNRIDRNKSHGWKFKYIEMGLHQ